jgi:hypothetical protein
MYRGPETLGDFLRDSPDKSPYETFVVGKRPTYFGADDRFDAGWFQWGEGRGGGGAASDSSKGAKASPSIKDVMNCRNANYQRMGLLGSAVQMSSVVSLFEDP